LESCPINLSALLQDTVERFSALREKEGYQFDCAIMPEIDSSTAYVFPQSGHFVFIVCFFL
jgi:hypothetical protein